MPDYTTPGDMSSKLVDERVPRIYTHIYPISKDHHIGKIQQSSIMNVLTSFIHKVAGSESPIRWNEHNMELIGSGSSGNIYLSKDQSGAPIVVKVAKIWELSEVKHLTKFSHKNIVKYLGAETKGETSYILMEYVPGVSISSHLMKGPFNEDKIRTYTQQLLWGLLYLHQNEIKHGDIKGANILVDAGECIKLSDFGLSKQGAQLWMAPEVLKKDLNNSRFTGKADIWSVGCTVIEMATGKDPWRGKYQAGASFLKHMDKPDSVPQIPYHLSSGLEIFLKRCLQRDPKSRASAYQLLQDPFITKKNIPTTTTTTRRSGTATRGSGATTKRYGTATTGRHTMGNGAATTGHGTATTGRGAVTTGRHTATTVYGVATTRRHTASMGHGAAITGHGTATTGHGVATTGHTTTTKGYGVIGHGATTTGRRTTSTRYGATTTGRHTTTTGQGVATTRRLSTTTRHGVATMGHGATTTGRRTTSTGYGVAATGRHTATAGHGTTTMRHGVANMGSRTATTGHGTATRRFNTVLHPTTRGRGSAI